MTDIGAPMDAIVGTDTTDSAPVGEGTTPLAPTENDGPKVNPAWNNLLEKLPAGLHGLVIPELQSWDKNFQEKTTEVQSRYAPYQSLLDNNVPPEQVENALRTMQMLQQDPRKFYEELGKFYEAEWGQGQEGQVTAPEEETFTLGEDDFDITKHPKFQELMQNQQVMAQYLQQQIEAEQQAAADKQIETDLKNLTEKYGEFDEEWVLALTMQKNQSLEDSVKAYHEFVTKVRTAPRAGDSAPPVFSPTGGVPSTHTDPRNMNRKDTRNLVAQLAKTLSEGTS